MPNATLEAELRWDRTLAVTANSGRSWATKLILATPLLANYLPARRLEAYPLDIFGPSIAVGGAPSPYTIPSHTPRTSPALPGTRRGFFNTYVELDNHRSSLDEIRGAPLVPYFVFLNIPIASPCRVSGRGRSM